MSASCLGCLLVIGLVAAAAMAQSRAAFDAARNKMVDDEIVAAGVKNPRVIQAMRDTPRHEFVSAQPAQERLLRHGPADRRRADHFAAVRRGLHDRGPRSAARRQGAGNRHRQRLSGGRAGQAGRARCTRSRSSRSWATRRRRPSSGCTTTTSTSRWATATRAGPNTPPSTRSSSPARRKKCRRPWSSNSKKAGGW